MNPDFKFDHSKTSLDDALGIDKSLLDSIPTKLKQLNDSFEENETLNPSRIIEEMLSIFSNEQICILAGIHIVDVYKQVGSIT